MTATEFWNDPTLAAMTGACVFGLAAVLTGGGSLVTAGMASIGAGIAEAVRTWKV